MRDTILFVLRCVIVIGCVSVFGIAAFINGQGHAPLSNADIVQMVKAGFDNSTILEAIGANKTAFDLSAQGLIALKADGVSPTVVNAMLTAADRKASEETSATSGSNGTGISSASSEVPDEVGVYVELKGKMTEMEPEIVNWRSGGFLKNMATMGMDKGNVNGTVRNPHSALLLSPPIILVIRCKEGTAPSEYQLLRLWEKPDRREFRVETGGVVHTSSGASMNTLQFQFSKVAPYTYRIDLENLGPGEYGLLPPGGGVTGSAASQGAIYTFRIEE